MTYIQETESARSMVQRAADGPGATGPAAGPVAFWATGPGVGEFRPETVGAPSEGEVRVRTLWTGVSRGTEALVMRGEVPESERERMRAPFQAGAFPFPVKYGYLNVGVVVEGARRWGAVGEGAAQRDPSPRLGSTVFTLFPHQSEFVVPADAVTVVPDAVPPRRAVLAGAIETAVNVLWDAGPALGDRVTVIGAGMIGCSIARLARAIPGVDVELVDVDEGKKPVAALLGVGFASPEHAAVDRDIVIEASGTPDGLRRALPLAATDGAVVVASWFGTRPVALELGADFHARRLSIVSSQVGEVAASRRGRRTRRQRLELALQLLDDSAFDVLVNGSAPWTELPSVMASLAEAEGGGLCTTIDWSRS